MEIQTKLNWDTFEPLFGTWASKIKPFFDKGGFDSIYAYLKKESQRGKKIAPDSRHTFRAFLETPLDKIKVVLLSYCPYHSFIGGVPVADGLAFSCSTTGKLQPSLEKFYEALEIELHDGLNLNYIKNPDLSYLAKEGVLLLNSALTVEKLKAGSHQDIWHSFTKYIIEECLAYTGIPIVLIGKDAQVFERYMTPLTHGYIFSIEHPSFAARQQTDWDTQNVFKKINTIIKNNNSYEINWLNEDKNDQNEIPF